MSRLRAQMQARIAYWQDEAERARANAARVGEQATAWAAGCQQGREDAISIAHAGTLTPVPGPPQAGLAGFG